MAKLSATQVEVLSHFAGITTSVKGRRRPNETTYRVLVKAGLLEPIDQWPYYRTTEAGRLAIGT